MTDNDIIKALECCTSWGCGTSCADCPLQNTGCIHFNKLGATLDLINRQKADLDKFTTLYANAKAESERLKEKNRNAMRCTPKAIRRAKAEAIKECLQEVRKRTSSYICAARIRWVTDEIEKEMVGDV